MKAIQKYAYLHSGSVNILHTKVFEIAPNKYKCLECGHTWAQSINSPQTYISILILYKVILVMIWN